MDEQTNRILLRVMASAKHDREHQVLISRCRELEALYANIMETLSPEQREIIDSYFVSCSQVDFNLIRLAYQCGRASTGYLTTK